MPDSAPPIAPARLLIAPSDLSRRFLLRLGGGAPRLGRAAPGAGATLRGPLAALLALAEARADSDALFFSGALAITGDAAPIAALRAPTGPVPFINGYLHGRPGRDWVAAA